MTALDRRALLGATAALAAASKLRAQEGGDTSTIGKTPHTKFAINAEIWWGGLPFIERVKKAAEYGFPAVEFWPWRNKNLDELGGTVKDLGLAITQFTGWGFNPGMCNPANHSKFVEEVKEACTAANRIDCPMMTIVAGNDQDGMTTDQMHAGVIAGLKLVAPIAVDHGVTLILEPMNGRVDHPGHCLYGSEAGVRICREVGSPAVKLNWDLYHAQLAEGDLCGHLKDGFDQLAYAQVADTPGRHEPGTGEINYPRVLRALHELGYRGHVGLECWPIEGEHQAALRVAAADQW